MGTQEPISTVSHALDSSFPKICVQAVLLVSNNYVLFCFSFSKDGLHDRILIALAFELNKALPRIMKDNPLKYLWAYKYDSEYTGISTHADQVRASTLFSRELQKTWSDRIKNRPCNLTIPLHNYQSL